DRRDGPLVGGSERLGEDQQPAGDRRRRGLAQAHMKHLLRGQGRRGEDGRRDGQQQVVRAPPRMSAGRTDSELHDLPPESPGAGLLPDVRPTSKTSVIENIINFKLYIRVKPP